MTNAATKIITWAANQSNAHGAHIGALTQAIDSDRVPREVKNELKDTRAEWVKENDRRFFGAA